MGLQRYRRRAVLVLMVHNQADGAERSAHIIDQLAATGSATSSQALEQIAGALTRPRACAVTAEAIRRG